MELTKYRISVLILLEFQETYNNYWRIARQGYKSPAQVKGEQLADMLMAA